MLSVITQLQAQFPVSDASLTKLGTRATNVSDISQLWQGQNKGNSQLLFMDKNYNCLFSKFSLLKFPNQILLSTNINIIHSFKNKNIIWAREISQSVKYLLCRYEDLILTSQIDGIKQKSRCSGDNSFAFSWPGSQRSLGYTGKSAKEIVKWTGFENGIYFALWTLQSH